MSTVGMGTNRQAHPKRQVMAGQTLGRTRVVSRPFKTQFAQAQILLSVSMPVVKETTEVTTTTANMGCEN